MVTHLYTEVHQKIYAPLKPSAESNDLWIREETVLSKDL